MGLLRSVERQKTAPADGPAWIRQALTAAGVSFASDEALVASLPFSGRDTTCGTETELQAAVAGRREAVDLPLTIESSSYFANILKRAAAGDAPQRLRTDLERYLQGNQEMVWENSWVRFPRHCLSEFADQVLRHDLTADKGDPASPQRIDRHRFFCREGGEEQLRLPISYLLKLSLADFLGRRDDLPSSLRQTGERLMGHFLNDNTSPETVSFHVVPLTPGGRMGREIARETAKRYLLSQLLVMYANERFTLRERGQQALVYGAPHPPVRQKDLNSCISDAFYREIFMSPCLSGWDRGEEKHRYMGLCHQVLSRSQLNAVAKLREAGIIVNNLVVLPNLSNISLANNGTHLSLGSRKLTAALRDPCSGFTPIHEKHMGDLAIKYVEHFLPLFVGTYSAAPYRLGFGDFHPELALGFLPHELDYTHLRMIWRRWKKKAHIRIFGQPVTPFGPDWFDRLLSGLFGLRGDFVPDFRLIDYLVSLLSTAESPALNGVPGNTERLRKDLAELGVFDNQMAVYLLYRLREEGRCGFSGFEGRHYSLFESMEDDLGRAADMQVLLTAMAYKWMARGGLNHRLIPDTPSVESERRQIFFGAAIGLPTFFVRQDTGNQLLRSIVARTPGTRSSRRYPGYLRVEQHEYRQALLQVIMEDGADLVELFGMRETMEDLAMRLADPERHSTAGKLTRGILAEVNAREPLKVNSDDFNRGAERYYRETLKRRHMEEALQMLVDDVQLLEREAPDGELRRGLSQGEPEGAAQLLRRVRKELVNETLPHESLERVMILLLTSIHADAVRARAVTTGAS